MKMRGRRANWMLALMVGISLALALLPVVWASPDQDAQRQTVPTATSPASQPDDDDDDDDDKPAPTPTPLPEAAVTPVMEPAVESTPSYLPAAGGSSGIWGWGILLATGLLLLVLARRWVRVHSA